MAAVEVNRRAEPRSGLISRLVLSVPFGVLLLAAPVTVAAQQPYRIGPPAGWITPLRADLVSEAPEARATNGYEMLLVDRQESVVGTALERYRHVAYRLLTEGSVEDNSQIELSVDPTYEQLILHGVTVIRDGKAVNQLKPGQIRVLDQESERDDHVFTGTVSVVVVLEKVKPGDVVEYSYTRRGDNPVFARHYMGSILLQQEAPVRETHFRLLWPQNRVLHIRPSDTAVQPVITGAGPIREYRWSATNVAGKLIDSDLPDWYDAYPYVQLSDFGSWSDVAAWGATLFATPGPAPGALRNRIARIRDENPSQEFQALAALRYVQDEVRYLGIEIGANSHKPFPVGTVLQRGYGDCKDKAQLLVLMLRELGIAASPVLVSTSYRDHLSGVEPTAAYFDHAIVRAEVEGKEYWLDPTALYQRGPLASVAAQFGVGLVLGGGLDSLVPMPRVAVAEPLTEVETTFELGEVGKPVTMRVVTDYRGGAATDLRGSIRGKSVEKLRRDFTEFYAEGYPGIEAEIDPDVEDNEATNVIHTVEQYTIPAFWHPSANRKGFVGTFDPVELDQVIPAPVAAGRTMPLAVRHPRHVRYRITAKLATGWSIAPKADTLRSPAMRFVRTLETDSQTLTLNYEYETLADHVAPADAAAHLEKLSRIRLLLAFSVTPPLSEAGAADRGRFDDTNWPVVLIALFTAALSLFIAVRVYRSPPPAWPRGPVEPPIEGDTLKGLGGWLGLLGLAVLLSPFRVLYTTVKSWPTYGAATWAQLTTVEGGRYHAMYAPALLLELVSNVAYIVFGFLLIVLFFGRRRWFPAMFVLVASVHTLSMWADLILASMLPAVQSKGLDWATHLRELLIVLLWIGYLFRSRRVRNTFVR